MKKTIKKEKNKRNSLGSLVWIVSLCFDNHEAWNCAKAKVSLLGKQNFLERNIYATTCTLDAELIWVWLLIMIETECKCPQFLNVDYFHVMQTFANLDKRSLNAKFNEFIARFSAFKKNRNVECLNPMQISKIECSSKCQIHMN